MTRQTPTPSSSSRLSKMVKSALLLGALLLGSCSVSFYGSSSTYSYELNGRAIEILKESSGVPCEWPSVSGGGTSYTKTGKWTNTHKWYGEVECEAGDLKTLGQNLFDGFRFDIFGAGYQIDADEERTALLPSTTNSIEFTIEFLGTQNRNKLVFKANPKRDNVYSFNLQYFELWE